MPGTSEQPSPAAVAAAAEAAPPPTPAVVVAASPATPSRPRWFRRRYIVDRRLQLQLLAGNLVWFFCAIALLSGLLFTPLLRELWRSQPATSDRALEAAYTLLHLHRHFWWAMLASSALIAIATVRFSHRVAGPLVRVKRHLRLMAEGRIPGPMVLRKRDFMTEEVGALNELADSLRRRIGALQEQAATVQARVGDCRQLVPVGPAAKALALLQADIERLRGSLDGFSAD